MGDVRTRRKLIFGFPCHKCDEPGGITSIDFICKKCGYFDKTKKTIFYFGKQLSGCDKLFIEEFKEEQTVSLCIEKLFKMKKEKQGKIEKLCKEINNLNETLDKLNELEETLKENK